MDAAERGGFVSLADLLRGGMPAPPASEPEPPPAAEPPGGEELTALVRDLRLLRAQLVDALEAAR